MSKICVLIFLFFGLNFSGLTAQEYSVSHRCSAIEKINQTICQETQKIHRLQALYGTTDEVLWLYNELGISYFFRDDFEAALSLFEYILEEKFSKYDRENLLIGAALWGRALCHVCLNMEKETEQDLQMLILYFRQVFQSDSSCDKKNSMFAATRSFFYAPSIIQAKLDFADPDERISASECRDRVRGSAQKLRLFVSPLIKSTPKRAIFLKFIDALEDQGLYCCRDGSIWVTCVSPLLEKLQKWKAIGIPADPAWD